MGDQARAAADRGVSISTIAANAGDLKRGLVDRHVVCLERVAAGMVARDGDVVRIVQHE